MRRIILLLTVGAVVAAMIAIGGTAFADPAPEECTQNVSAPGTLTCVTTDVTEETEFVVSEATEFVETQVTEFVESVSTEFVERATIGACQVGQSGRVGTTEGIATDEVLVTTTEEFLVTTTEEVLITTTDEVLVTTTKTVTKIFRGGQPNPNQLLDTKTVTEVERELIDTVEEREVVDTVVERDLVDTVVEREVVNTTFTASGKCKNTPGPQPQTQV